MQVGSEGAGEGRQEGGKNVPSPKVGIIAVPGRFKGEKILKNSEISLAKSPALAV